MSICQITKLNNIVKINKALKVIPASFIIILIAFIHFLNICISYVYMNMYNRIHIYICK